MRKHYLLLMSLLFPLATMMSSGGAFAQTTPTDAEYEAALAAIEDGGVYWITMEDDGMKYYVTSTGDLIDADYLAGCFTLTKRTGGAFKPTGIRIYTTAGTVFTNPDLSNSKAVLNSNVFKTTNGNDRDTWERQVFFLNEEGKFAIRSCNTVYGESSWEDAGRTFWTYDIGPVPAYSYDPAYIWSLEVPTLSAQVHTVLNGIETKYGEYAGDTQGYAIKLGTGFGERTDAETWQKFIEMLDEVETYLSNLDDPDYDYNSDPDAPTLSYANTLASAMDSLYQVVLDSEVPYMMPQDGYYRIIAHNRYKSEFDPSGFVDKAIAASFDKNHPNKAVYSTLNRDRANFLWKLTQHGDSVMIQNAGMGTFISPASDNPENKLILTEDESQALHVMFDYAGYEYVEPDGLGDDRDCFAIRLARSPRDPNGRYVHQMEHASALDDTSPWGTYGTDSGKEIELGFWRRTYDNDLTRSDAWASEWFLEYVSDEEAQELIDAFEIIKNHDVLVAQNAALRAEVYAALVTAKDSIRTGLIKTASQMSSPHSQNDIGTSKDGGDLSAGVLIDGDKNTYWHSAWQNTPQEPHYIQISDMEDMLDNCELYICDRNTTSGNWPNEFTLYGSNDPEAEAEAWDSITVMPLKTGASVENTIPFFSPTSYKYVRVVATNKSNFFWHAAELQIYIVRENPNSQFALLGDVAEELDRVYADNAATDDADITLEMYEELEAAYKAFLAAMVDPTELRNALATYKNVTASVVEGTNPGEWASTEIASDYDDLYAEIEAYDKAGRYTAAQNHKYAVMLKAMKQSVMEKANVIQTDKWYRFMVPTEEMYDAYEFSKAGVDKTSLREDQATLYGTFAVSGKEVSEDGFNDQGDSIKINHIETLAYEDIREGSRLFFMEDDAIEDKATSMFRFVERPNVEADNVSLFKGVKENMQLALDMSQTYTRGEKLITDASQLSSNASDSSEGLHIEYLIDGSINTYWHSDYHKKTIAPGYIQVALNEPVSGYIQVDMTRRQNATNGHIVRMYILGSNDAETWTNVGYLETPFTNQNESVTSLPVNLGGSYSYLRFILTNRYGTDGGGNTEFDPFAEPTSADEYNKLWTYFHAAEFQIYPLTPNNDLSASGKALEQAYNAANKVLLLNAQAEDVVAAIDAYRAYRTEFNQAEGKDVLPIGKDKAAPQYAIQNKATGLFVNAKEANTNDVFSQLVPTFFTYSTPGYSRSLLHGVNINGTDCSYLHVGETNRRLCTWNVTDAYSNSALAICEAEEEYAAPASFEFYRDIKPGAINAWTSMMTITPAAENEGVAYSSLGRLHTSEGDFLALKTIDTFPAGEPVIYIFEDTLNYDAEDDYVEPMLFSQPGTPEFVEKGDTINGLVASFVNHTLLPREIYFTRNYARSAASLMNKEIKDINPSASSGYYISGPCVYLDLDICPAFDASEESYDFAIFLGSSAEMADGVQTIPAAIEKVSQRGNVYSVDGKLLRTDATLSSLKTLGKGMYILNGVKVLVK